MNKSFFFFALILFLAGAYFIGHSNYSNFKILSSPHDKAMAFYASALKSYEANDLDKCIVNLERAIEAEPTNKKVNILMVHLGVLHQMMMPHKMQAQLLQELLLRILELTEVEIPQIHIMILLFYVEEN